MEVMRHMDGEQSDDVWAVQERLWEIGFASAFRPFLPVGEPDRYFE